MRKTPQQTPPKKPSPISPPLTLKNTHPHRPTPTKTHPQPQTPQPCLDKSPSIPPGRQLREHAPLFPSSHQGLISCNPRCCCYASRSRLLRPQVPCSSLTNLNARKATIPLFPKRVFPETRGILGYHCLSPPDKLTHSPPAPLGIPSPFGEESGPGACPCVPPLTIPPRTLYVGPQQNTPETP